MISFKNSMFITLSILAGINNSVVASSAPEHASTIETLELNATNIALVSALAASLIRFWTREGNNNPSRFDWDQLASGQDPVNQSLYFVDDEIIGHSGKGSYQQADTKTGETKFSTPVEPKGLFGFISAHHKGVIKALGATWLTVTVVELLSDENNRKKPEEFIKALGAKIKQLGAWTTLPKYANIGASALIAGYLTT